MRTRFVFLSLLLTPCLTQAASIFGSESNVNEIGVNTPCFTGFQTVSGETCSGTTAVSGTSAQVTYDAFGLASYGTLGAFAQGSITPGTVTSGAMPTFINI